MCFDGLGGKEPLRGVAEDIAQMDVDRSRGPVIVHVGIEVHARIEEHVDGPGRFYGW